MTNPVFLPLSKPVLGDIDGYAFDGYAFAVNYIAFLPVKNSCLEAIRNESLKDSTMTQLKDVIVSGWPTHKSSVPAAIAPFFDYRDELTVYDGLILRGERIVIPQSVRQEIKTKVHSGHLGIN